MSAPKQPADVYADIADRRRRGQTFDQLVLVGERTGWWTADDVDRVFDGHTRPAAPDDAAAATEQLPNAAAAESARLDQLTAELTEAGVIDVEPAPVGPDQMTPSEFVVFVAGDMVKEIGDMSAERKAAALAAVAGVDPVDQPECDPVGVVQPAAAPPGDVPTTPAPPATDLLARGLAHPDPKVRVKAERARAAVDALCTALMRRSA